MIAALTSTSRLSIGIVTYDSAHVIERTLKSFAAADMNGLEIEILVRDNGSRDGTLDLLTRLAKQIDKLRVVSATSNIGYGRGHNDILHYASGQIYVICNPDIVVPRDFYHQCVLFLSARPDVGLMSPRMIFPNGSLQHSNRRNPTILDLALRLLLPAFVRSPRRLAWYEMVDQGYDHSYDVPFCSGALMVCRMEALLAVGGFDERYFLYFEDADLSREFQKSGWRTVFNPEVTIVHGWERAAHKNWRMALIMMRSAVRYFTKWGWRIW